MRLTEGRSLFGRKSIARKGVPQGPRRRSLQAALAEAGLADVQDEPLHEFGSASPLVAQTRRLDAAVRASIFAAQRKEPAQPVPPPEPVPHEPVPLVSEPKPRHAQSGVVSPPPWMRAARRGRRQSRLQNAFGWAVTLAVVGGIVGFAGHYLAVPPMGSATIQASTTGR